MGATENKNLIQAGFDSWAQGGDFFQLLADDVQWTVIGSCPLSGTYTSRQQFLDRAIQPLAERLTGPIRPTVQKIVAEGDSVVVLWSGQATAKDGRPYDNSYCWILQIEAGKVREATAFFDTELLTDIWEQ